MQQVTRGIPVGLAVAAAITLGFLLGNAPRVTAALIGVLVSGLVAIAGPGAVVPLESTPALVDFLAGENPFPDGFVRVSLVLLLSAAIGIQVLRRRVPTPDALAATSVLATILLGTMLLLNHADSEPLGYGQDKATILLVWNTLVLIAGILIGWYERQILVFAVFTAAVGAAFGFLVLVGLASDSLDASMGSRVSLGASDHPITLGRVAAAGLLAALYLSLALPRRRLRLIVAGTMPLAAVALLAAGSRGPTLALAVGIATLFIVLRPRSSVRRELLWSLVVLVPIGIYLVGNEVPTRNVARAADVFLSGPTATDANGRYGVWSEGVDAFLAHPLTGIGSGGFSSVDPVARYPHNVLLEVAAEMGLVGVLLLGAVAVSGGIATRRALAGSSIERSFRPQVAFIVGGALMALVNAMVSGDVTTNAGLWLAVGMTIGMNMAISHRHQPITRN